MTFFMYVSLVGFSAGRSVYPRLYETLCFSASLPLCLLNIDSRNTCNGDDDVATLYTPNLFSVMQVLQQSIH